MLIFKACIVFQPSSLPWLGWARVLLFNAQLQIFSSPLCNRELRLGLTRCGAPLVDPAATEYLHRQRRPPGSSFPFALGLLFFSIFLPLSCFQTLYLMMNSYLKSIFTILLLHCPNFTRILARYLFCLALNTVPLFDALYLIRF